MADPFGCNGTRCHDRGPADANTSAGLGPGKLRARFRTPAWMLGLAHKSRSAVNNLPRTPTIKHELVSCRAPTREPNLCRAANQSLQASTPKLGKRDKGSGEKPPKWRV